MILWAVLGTVLVAGAVIGAIVWAARRPIAQTPAERAGAMLAGGQRFPAPPPVAGNVRFRGGYYTQADGRTSAWGSFDPVEAAPPPAPVAPAGAAGGGINIAPIFHNYGAAPARPAQGEGEVPPPQPEVRVEDLRPAEPAPQAPRPVDVREAGG